MHRVQVLLFSIVLARPLGLTLLLNLSQTAIDTTNFIRSLSYIKSQADYIRPTFHQLMRPKESKTPTNNCTERSSLFPGRLLGYYKRVSQ